MKIAVLCAHKKSNYFRIPELEVYDELRDCKTFKGGMPIIAHPPCAQWSRMKFFSNNNPEQKELANYCLTHFLNEGGIYEHPHWSSVWKELDFPKEAKFIQVDQHWFGFPARKRTTLCFYKCNPIQYPLNFDAIQYVVATSKKNSLPEMKKSQRSITTMDFNQYLVNCINQTFKK